MLRRLFTRLRVAVWGRTPLEEYTLAFHRQVAAGGLKAPGPAGTGRAYYTHDIAPALAALKQHRAANDNAPG